MKKLVFGLIATIMIVIVGIFLSCEKKDNEKDNLVLKNRINYGLITVDNGILCFENPEHVQQTMNILEEQLNQYQQSLEPLFEGLSDDELVELAENTTIVFEQPLLDFEALYNYNSLRKVLSEAEEEWLSHTEGEDINEDPDNHFILDDIFRVLLNEYVEIKIGNTYYKGTEEGWLEIPASNIVGLLRLRTTDSLSLNAGNQNQPMAGDCSSMKIKWGYQANGQRRIKWVIGHVTFPTSIGRYVIAKTKNYYKNNRNRWRKYATYCYVKAYGHISGQDGNCETQFDFNPNNNYVLKPTARKVRHKILVSTKTKSGWVKGYHKGISSTSHAGIVYNSTLDWY